MAIQIRIRRDTASNWTSTNPVLGLGEPGLETDTRKLKYGDGTTAWASLPYGSDSGFDGAYASLTGKPALFDGAYSSLTGSPSLATVATTGAYSDLSGSPSVPTNLDSLTDVTITTPSSGQVLKYDGAAWVNGTDATGTSGITLTSLSITSSAASGNGSLAYDNTTGVFTFTPASVPSLTGYATETYVSTYVTWANVSGKPTFSTVATTGAYSDLSGKPTLFDGAYSSLTGSPSLATVATTGAYSDLTGVPSIPSIAGLLSWTNAPATATSTGTTGQIAYDAAFMYVCTATDTWVRTPLSTW